MEALGQPPGQSFELWRAFAATLLRFALRGRRSAGWAGGNFIMGHLRHSALFCNDEFHGDWNSIKLACEKSDAYFWGTIVSLA